MPPTDPCAPNGKSIRQNIIEALYVIGDAMTDQQGKRLWNKVVFGPVHPLGMQELPALGIDPGPDKASNHTMAKTEKEFVVTVDFDFQRDTEGKVDNYLQYEYIYTKLVYAFTANQQVGGAIQIRETGAGSEIEGRGDPRPGGYFLLQVVYRHDRTNPTKRP